MSTLQIIIGGVIVWLFMVRMCLRWTFELDQNILMPLVVASFFFWWIGIPMMLPERLAKSTRLGDQHLRLLLGESGWHRRERLDNERKQRIQEHESRAKELGLPIK